MNKNLLSENMLRFGTKNLSESQQKQLIVKSIMETIDQNGLRSEIRRKLNEQSGSVPESITINYDNGMLRFNQFFKNGDLVWDVNAVFKGSANGLTISEIQFVPSYEAPADAVTQKVPLMAPFTVATPMDAGGGQGPTWEALQKKFDAGIKLNLKSPAMTAVLAACDPSKGNAMSMQSLNMVLGSNILSALYAYCGKNGWYTGPKKDVATMYAIFTNHDGQTTNV